MQEGRVPNFVIEILAIRINEFHKASVFVSIYRVL
jgi:hypothetical protein